MRRRPPSKLVSARTAQLASCILIGITVAAVPSAGAEASPTVRIVTDRMEANAGSRSAGKLCLPNGDFDKFEFLPQLAGMEEELTRRIASAPVDAIANPAATSVELALIKVTLKLCAKSIGPLAPHRPNAFSGRADYQIGLTFRGVDGAIIDQRECSFSFREHEKLSASAGEIFAAGLRHSLSACAILQQKIGG